MKNKLPLVFFWVMFVSSFYCVFCANTLAERKNPAKDDPIFFMLAAIWLILVGLFVFASGLVRVAISDKPETKNVDKT